MSERGGAGHPLVELTRARILEFLREPGALFWVFVFPVLVAVGLGIAFRSTPPERLRVAVVASDPGHPTEAESAALAALTRSPELTAELLDAPAAQRALEKSKVDLLVSVTSSTSVLFKHDPAQPKSRTARLAASDALEGAAGRVDRLAKRDLPLLEPGERYIDFLVPGLIGLNLMGSSMWGIGYAVVTTRSRKLMKRFAATPMRRSHYLLSFMLSRFIFLFLEVTVLVAFARVVFGVEVRGSVASLALLSTLGAFAFAGIALLVAARPRSVESASGWMNFVMMPMWFLSGSFFSYERFPELIHPLLRLLPLTALNDALRAVMNDGSPLSAVLLQVFALSAWTVLSFALALRLFRWQ